MPYTINVDNSNEPQDLRELGLAAAELRAIKSKLLAYLLDINNNVDFNNGNLFVDVVNQRVGINQQNPTKAFHVVGEGLFSGNITAPRLIGTADAWTNARTLTLGGHVSGSASFDGSADVSLNVTIANDSHTHDGRYFTETESDARFLGITATAVNAAALNNLTSSQFLRSDANNVASGTQTWNGVSTFATAVKINTPTAILDFASDASSRNFARVLQSNNVRWNWRIGANGDLGINPTAAQRLRISGARIFADDYHPNADKLTTARTISISGGAAGSASFDGSANIDISLTVTDNSHSHTIANVTGLQAALDSDAQALADHEGDSNNPHNVTKAQVGLGNVDNHPTTQSNSEADANKVASGATVARAAPVGEVAMFYRQTIPEGWLYCDGSQFDPVTYPKLYAELGDSDTLPDMRGEFPRGWDDGRGVDPGRVLGSAQADQDNSINIMSYSTVSSGSTNSSITVPTDGTASARFRTGDEAGGTSHGSARFTKFGREVRGRNVALMFCIKHD